MEKKFPTVFSGKIGMLRNFVLKLHIDKSVKPLQAAPRKSHSIDAKQSKIKYRKSSTMT